MTEYKVAFWALMALLYVAFFWAPSFLVSDARLDWRYPAYMHAATLAALSVVLLIVFLGTRAGYLP